MLKKINDILFYPALYILCWVSMIITLSFDLDFGSRLAVGRTFWQLGRVLKKDIFAFTNTKPIWVDHEWGSSVIFYFIADHFGDIGLILLKTTALFVVLFLINKISKLQENAALNNILFYILLIFAMYNGFATIVRCQIFTFLFFTLWIYILERIRRGENRLLWILPATMLVWANMHGGFVTGIGLIGMYAIGEFLNKKPFKKYLYILIPTALVILINPYGFEYIKYIAEAVTMARLNIPEWHPTKLFGSFHLWWAFKCLVLLSVISLAGKFSNLKSDFQKYDKVQLILLLATFLMAIKHIKHQPFFVITVGCFIYNDLTLFFNSILNKIKTASGKFYKAEQFLNSTILIFIIAVGTLIISHKKHIVNVSPKKYPIGSIEFIKQNHINGKLVTMFYWGSYASWKLYPQCLIAIDGRYEETYPDTTEKEVTDFIYILDNNWYSFAKKYKPDILLIDSGIDSISYFKKHRDWTLVYQDFISSLFIRSDKVRKDYINPMVNMKEINKNKYNTSIDFLDKIE